MGTLLSYSLASGLVLASLYMIYKWVMASENQHRFNRGVLIGIYVAAFALPLLMKVDFAALVAGAPEAEATSTSVVVEALFVGVLTGVCSTPLWLQVVLGVYVAGMVAVGVQTAVVAVRLANLLRKGERRREGAWTLVLLPADTVAPFSWGRYMVMNRADFDASGRVISIHEARHIASRHWLDLLLAQVVVILQWFNPAAWLMREELKTVHEYEADEAVLRAGVDPYEYQMLLIKKTVGARFPSLANSLNHSKLKKRVTMMYQNRSGARARIRSLALVPAAALALMALNLPAVASVLTEASMATIELSRAPQVAKPAQSAKSAKSAKPTGKVTKKAGNTQTAPEPESNSGKESTGVKGMNVTAMVIDKQSGKVTISGTPSGEEPLSVSGMRVTAMVVDKQSGNVTVEGDLPVQPEKIAEFPGGLAEMMKFLATNMKYPVDAQEAKAEGTVVVKFNISADGKVSNPEIVRGAFPSLETEAKRVILAMPAWTPATDSEGRAISTTYTLPVKFKIPKATPKK